MNEYAERNRLLKELGFADYAAYQKSDLWFSIRDRVYNEKGRTCTMCQERPATCVHHNRYGMKDLRGRRLTWLEPLCNECHHSIEYDLCGKKHPVSKARELYEQGRKSYAASHPGAVVAAPKHAKPHTAPKKKSKKSLVKGTHDVKTARCKRAQGVCHDINERLMRIGLCLKESVWGQGWLHWIFFKGRNDHVLWYYPHTQHWINMKTKSDGYCEPEQLVELLGGDPMPVAGEVAPHTANIELEAFAWM